MKIEKECPHVKFDEIWGEWKCLKYQVRLYPEKHDFCVKCIGKRKKPKKKCKTKKHL